MKTVLAATLLFTAPLTAQNIEIVHCPNGCPTGDKLADNTTVVREIFTLSNDPTTKFADWVAYRVTSETIGTSKDHNRTWQTEDMVDGSETLEPKDYDGAFRGLDTHRGHQAPLAAFSGTVYWRDTNFLSNITPQKEDLNAGSWMHLEGAVRNAAYKLREVFVVTGPLYDPDENQMTLPQADESHEVPTGYWKVVYTKAGKATAFMFDQDVARNINYCSAITSVADVENASGLDIWPQEASWPSGDLKADLGC